MRRQKRSNGKSSATWAPVERASTLALGSLHPPPPRPTGDAEFDTRLLAFLDGVMRKADGTATARRISFGVSDIRLDMGLCSVTCYTRIEWLGADGRRRLIEADHREGSAKHGALLHLLGSPAIGARLLPEGLQIDFQAGGTLHFARADSGIGFEVDTPEFGPALY